VAVALVAAAGWGVLSRPDPRTGVGPVGASSQPAPTPSRPPASAGPSHPSPDGSSRAATCRKADLDLSLGSGDSGSGHRSVALIFTNRGAQPCRITGYPGVAALDAGGTQVAQAQRTVVAS